jgi:hypothetical protein
MSGDIPALPQYALMAWCSVKKKYRNNFTFTFYSEQTKSNGDASGLRCQGGDGGGGDKSAAPPLQPFLIITKRNYNSNGSYHNSKLQVLLLWAFPVNV